MSFDEQLGDAVVATLRVTAVLESLSVEYLVGGSLASSLHGVPRSTDDADLVADLTRRHAAAFVAGLSDDFFVDAEMVDDAIRRRASFNVLYRPAMFKVDVFVLKETEAAVEELLRRVRVQIVVEPPRFVYMATAEDTVLQKLAWYRLGGEVSDRQWKDLAGVLRVQSGRLDVSYMKRWSRPLGVEDLLERALAESSDAR